MTRDAEHTPSPQSVVVPVELMTLSLKAAEQFIVNGIETGYRSSAPEAIKAAYKRGWNDREDDIIERAERIAPEARS